MKRGKKRMTETAARPAAVQLRRWERHPFGALGEYVPLGNGETRLYRAVREAVPVVDAAIYKLIRMTGGLTVSCEDPGAERELGEFLRTVPAGRGQFGLNAFLDCYLDSLLTCGRAVGEIVPGMGNRDIAALLCGRVEDIEIREGTSPLDFAVWGPGRDGRMERLPYQDLILFTPLNPEAEHPYGVSLLRSLPFLADILMKIYNTIGVNWERCGNVRFAVTCPGGEGAGQRGQMLAEEWSRAMRETRGGSVRDFVAAGDVNIRVIGADAPVLDSQAPVRQILEQLVAKTGIPPFMLGLNWSSTERMSAQQADMLTTEITALRRTLTPAAERICRLWLRMHGFACGFRVVWDDINLQDQVEEARAELYREQARRLKTDAAGGGDETKGDGYGYGGLEGCGGRGGGPGAD
ncbi:serine/threonine protein phosphatase [uncultured Oscillibacter sp.]|uniref:serine/threonine protein phosphatase n=1 Tax=uncultured Oscillibacter sp. TaxID=876091 RepID=UPI0025D7B78B|nr:serine/threonine protein phosphatase [uncultured Oscillibacter sp.]